MVDSDLPGDLPLKLCISGAAPLPVQVLKEFQKKFKVPLLEGYGLSEASPVVSINPVKGPWKEGSVGIPIPGVSVCIQNDSGDILKPKEIGEICVKGNNVMKGYWNQQQSTAQAFRNGWLLTGDIGYIDEDGYIFITDRKKDMILVNGINVYPREIEEVLYRYPGVHEAAVVGAKDIRKGEQPIAFISVLPGVKLEKRKVGTFLRSYLADYKVPKKIIVLDALPRNANGKILKPVLKQMLNNQDYTIQDQAD
jgi:long-chain acyl-CoA synthetase